MDIHQAYPNHVHNQSLQYQLVYTHGCISSFDVLEFLHFFRHKVCYTQQFGLLSFRKPCFHHPPKKTGYFFMLPVSVKRLCQERASSSNIGVWAFLVAASAFSRYSVNIGL